MRRKLSVSKPRPQRKLLAGDVVSTDVLKVITGKSMQEGADPHKLANRWRAKSFRTIYPRKR